jgi:hypothetical protein
MSEDVLWKPRINGGSSGCRGFRIWGYLVGNEFGEAMPLTETAIKKAKEAARLYNMSDPGGLRL